MTTFTVRRVRHHRHDHPDTELVKHHVLVLCAEPLWGDHFLATVCGRKGRTGVAVVQDQRVRLDVFSPGHDAAQGPLQGPAPQAILALIHFTDALTINATKQLLAAAPPSSTDVRIVVSTREVGGTQYKINCTCGQKLSVDDEETGRKGRCPACNAKFVVPSEEAWLRSQGLVTDRVPLMKAFLGHRPECLAPLEYIVKKIHEHEAAMMSQTMRIKMASGDTLPGETRA